MIEVGGRDVSVGFPLRRPYGDYDMIVICNACFLMIECSNMTTTDLRMCTI